MKYRLKLFFLIFSFALFIFSCFVYLNRDSNLLKVYFLNIGQGDAIFIKTPNGNQVLIDAGPGRNILRELGKVMSFYDRTIDLVLATHPDSDHVGGFPDVLKKYRVDFFVESGVEGDSGLWQEVEFIVNKNEILSQTKKVKAKKGMTIDLGEGVFLEIVFPDRDPKGMETNTASIVARLVYGDNEFLFTGDSPIGIENYLTSKECYKCLTFLSADVLKVGHHGSRTSSSEGFIKAVNPKYAIISVGKNNKYGHPHKEVLDILDKFNINTLRTDIDGRVLFESDGVNLKIK